MPDDALLAFLRARLDEREAKARAADVKQADPVWFVSPVVASAPRHFTVRSAQDKRPIARVADLAGDDDADAVGILNGEAVAAFIADNDPKTVLDDVAAKRRIIEAHQSLWQDEPPEHLGPGCKTCSGEVEGWPCTTLRLLALPFAGHPDYREEFKP